MSEPEKELTTIIPDFFFELIGRIAPGFVVIALSLYWTGSGSDFKTVFSNIGLSAFALAAAWIIGVTLDIGVYCILAMLRDVGVYCIGKRLPFEKWWPPHPEDYGFVRWEYLLDASVWERGIINKTQALLIFFRNMMSVCALTALICIIMEYSSTLDSWLLVFRLRLELGQILDSLLPVLHIHHLRYGILADVFLFVFFLSWRLTFECLYVGWPKMFERHRNRPNEQAPT